MSSSIKDENLITFLEFSVWEKLCAVDVKSVREVVRSREINILSDTSSSMIVGVIALRDEVVPVININKMLEVRRFRSITMLKKMIIVTCDSDLLAIPVSKATGLVRVPQEEVRSMDGNIFFDKIINMGKRRINILNLKNLGGLKWLKVSKEG